MGKLKEVDSYETSKRKQLVRLIQKRDDRKYTAILRDVQELTLDDVIIAIEEEYHRINGHRGYVVTQAKEEETDE